MALPPDDSSSGSKTLGKARKQLDGIFESLVEINLEKHICDKEETPLSRGGSCDVFLAWSTKHNKKVVVKRFRYFLLDDISFAKVRHPSFGLH